MSSPHPIDALEQGLTSLATLVRGEPELAREFEDSVRDFFGAGPPAGDPRAVLLAARRHLEWFLLERHSPALFGVPVERRLDAWRAADGELAARVERSLLDAFAGTFVVTEVRPGAGAWVRDLAGFGSYALVEPEVELRPGDLLAGRLFPLEGGLHVASRAVAVFRDPGLVEALERDFEQAREARGGKVLHLSQRELETMFWGAGREPVPEDPVEHARAFLMGAGVAGERARELLARLAASPCDPRQVLHGAGDVLGEVLDELAFETRVDLDGARRVLLQAWTAFSAPERTARERPRDPRAAVEAFARGRAAGVDLESLIADLERDLALGPVGDEDDEADAPAPDFPGVVGALVEEFLWDVGREQGEAVARRFEVLRALGEFGARLGVAEELDAQQLLRFTTFWIHERGGLAGADEARALLDALEAFCGWAEEAHGLPLRSDFGATLGRLRESLPRVAELNRMLERPPAEDDGELFEVREDARGRLEGLIDRAGAVHRVRPERGLAERLRGGDRLRGRLHADGRLALYRCYPPEAAELAR